MISANDDFVVKENDKIVDDSKDWEKDKYIWVVTSQDCQETCRMSPPQQVNVKLNGNVGTYLIVEPLHSSAFLISSLL